MGIFDEIAKPSTGGWSPIPEKVEYEDDMERVLALPRRPVPNAQEQKALAAKWTLKLRNDAKTCVCAKLRPEVVARGQNPCITELRPLQGWYLEEAVNERGALGFISIGGGKTGLDILLACALAVDSALLLIRPQDLPQFGVDFRVWSQHFRTPNCAGSGQPFVVGRPTLEVLSYSKLQHPNQTSYLSARQLDLIIGDEIHALKERNSARTGRFLRYIASRPNTLVASHSGSLTTRALTDVCHIAAVCLKEGSPLPLDPSVAEAWSQAVDPKLQERDPGALGRLPKASETLEQGLHRRIVETPGVVCTTDAEVEARLVFYRTDLEAPGSVRKAIGEVRRTEQRPDGEELVSAMEVAACCMQLACGFYYRWRFPRGEPEELITRWFKARQEWHRELRDELKNRKDGQDSPKLLRDAAERKLSNYTGELYTWKSYTLGPWKSVEKLVRPEPDVVWQDRYLVEIAAQVAREREVIVWYDFRAFGEALKQASRLPFYAGGSQASLEILTETGKRSIIASRHAHGTGKNLQAFHEQLWPNPPSDGGAWEQGIGRSHRYGQPSPEVRVGVFTHTDEHRKALTSGIRYAKYIQEISGNPQKLLYGTWEFDPEEQ